MGGQVRNKSKTGLGKLTADEVRHIRACKSLYYYSKKDAIAKRLGVPKSTIDNVWREGTYLYVD